MPIYSVEDLRSQLAGQVPEQTSDAELVLTYSNMTGQDPMEVAEYLGVSTGRDSGDFSAGFSSGIDQLQGLGYGALAAGAQAVGARGVQDFALQGMRAQDAEGYLAGRPELNRVEDVDSFGGAVDFAQYQIGKTLPTMLGIGAAGAATGGLGLGAGVGAVGAGYTVGVGSLYQSAEQARQESLARNGYASDVNLGEVFAKAVPYAAAEAALPYLGTTALRGGLSAIGAGGVNQIASRTGRTLATGAGGAITEAGTEVFQTSLEASMNPYLSQEELDSMYLNAAVTGGLVGGGLSAAGGAVSRGPEPTPQIEQEQEQEQDLLTAPEPEVVAPEPVVSTSGVQPSLFVDEYSRLDETGMPEGPITKDMPEVEAAQAIDDTVEQAEQLEMDYIGNTEVGDFLDAQRELFSVGSGTTDGQARRAELEISALEDKLAELVKTQNKAAANKKTRGKTKKIAPRLKELHKRQRDAITDKIAKLQGVLDTREVSIAAREKVSTIKALFNKLDLTASGTVDVLDTPTEQELAVLQEASPAFYDAVVAEIPTETEAEVEVEVEAAPVAEVAPEVETEAEVDLFSGLDTVVEEPSTEVAPQIADVTVEDDFTFDDVKPTVTANRKKLNFNFEKTVDDSLKTSGAESVYDSAIEDNEQVAAAIAKALKQDVENEQGKTATQVTLPQQVLKAIVSMATQGGDAKPVVRQAGLAAVDEDATAQYAEQIEAINKALFKVGAAAQKMYNAGSNISKGEKADNKNSRAEQAGVRNTKKMEFWRNKVRIHAQELVDVAGGDANVDAVMAVLKAAKESSSQLSGGKLDKERFAAANTLFSKQDGKLQTRRDLADVLDTTVSSIMSEIKNNTLEGKGDVVRPSETRANRAESSKITKSGKAKKVSTKTPPLVEANNKGGALAVIDRITKLGTSSAYAKALGSLIKRGIRSSSDPKSAGYKQSNVKIEFFPEGSTQRPYYDPNTDTVFISETASQEEVLHELLHAATQWAFVYDPNSEPAMKLKEALRGTIEYFDGALESMDMSIADKDKAREVFTKISDLYNQGSETDAVLELIAYGATFRQFKEVLKRIDANKSANPDASRFINNTWSIIRRFFAYVLGAPDSVAQSVLDNTMLLIEKSAGREYIAPLNAGQGSANVLYQAVDNGPSTVSDAQLDNPVYQAQKRLSDDSLLSTKVFFDMFSGLEVGKKFESGMSAIAAGIRKNFPKLEQSISLMANGFSLDKSVSSLLQGFKLDRDAPFQFVDELMTILERATPEKALAISKYLDGDVTAFDGIPNSITTKEIADEVKATFDKLVNELPVEDRKFFQENKFTDALYYADSVEGIASGGFNASRKISRLNKNQSASLSDEAIIANLDLFDVDEYGNPILDGDFYKVSYVFSAGSDVETTFVSKAVYDRLDGNITTLPAETHTVETGRTWQFRGKDKKGKSVFNRKYNTSESKDAAKSEDFRLALGNTMRALASSYSANKLFDGLSSYGLDGNGQPVVFDSLEEASESLSDTGVSFNPEVLDLSNAKNLERGSENALSARGNYRRTNTWVKMPATGFGELSGKIVHGPVFNALVDMNSFGIDFGTNYSDAMRWWKKSKTVYSVGTQVTNFASNLTLMYMHDIPLATVAQAAKLLYKFHNNPDSLSVQERKVVMAFKESGASLGSFSSVEITKAISDSMQGSFKEAEHKGFGAQVASMLNGSVNNHRKAIQTAKRMGLKVDDVLTDLYAGSDNTFRLASFMGDLKLDENGEYSEASVREAGTKARFNFVDYNIDSMAPKYLRQTVMPFISWTYGIMPVMGKIITQKPWKLANVLVMYAMLDGIMASLAEGDDDEARKMGPEKLDDRMFGFGPRMHIRIPFLGSEENPYYYRLGDYIPLASTFGAMPNPTYGQDWMPSGFAPSGPLLSAMTIVLAGVDPYTGEKISAATDTNAQDAWNRTLKIWDTIAPPIPSSSNFNRLTDYIEGNQDWMGNPPDGAELLFSKIMGLKVVQFDAFEESQIREIRESELTREYGSAIRKLQRGEMRAGAPDYESLMAEMNELQTRMQEEINEVYKREQ
jgi:hypothetical protein